jgi:uncharacterized protein
MSPTDRLRRALVAANKRVLTALRSKDAATVTEMPVRHAGFGSLRGRSTCLVVSYRRDGRPVAQPVWPGLAGDRLYVWTEERAYKARRIRRDPNVLVAPCTFRGRPLGAPVAGRARVLDDPAERAFAEAVVRDGWGAGRRAFERLSRPLTGVVYIEIVPAG